MKSPDSGKVRILSSRQQALLALIVGCGAGAIFAFSASHNRSSRSDVGNSVVPGGSADSSLEVASSDPKRRDRNVSTFLSDLSKLEAKLLQAQQRSERTQEELRSANGILRTTEGIRDGLLEELGVPPEKSEKIRVTIRNYRDSWSRSARDRMVTNPNASDPTRGITAWTIPPDRKTAAALRARLKKELSDIAGTGVASEIVNARSLGHYLGDLSDGEISIRYSLPVDGNEREPLRMDLYDADSGQISMSIFSSTGPDEIALMLGEGFRDLPLPEQAAIKR